MATTDEPITENRAASNKAPRRLLAKAKRGEEITLRETFAACPFRSVIGTAGRLNAANLIDHIGAVIALIEDEPWPIDAHVMAGLQAELSAGRTALILAIDRSIRDRAKKTILGMALPARGAA